MTNPSEKTPQAQPDQKQQGDQAQKPGQQSQTPGQAGQQGDQSPASKPAEQQK